MRVAVAADGSEVAEHFGRCEGYLMAEINDGQMGETKHVANPGHEPGRLPALLRFLGVERVVVGGTGQRAISQFEDCGITAIAGVQGSAESALARLAAGTLEAGESTCRHETDTHA